MCGLRGRLCFDFRFALLGPAQTVAVIGAGPAGLMAAETLARAGVQVTVYERMPAPGRKFLLAGRGGLNLTHSEDLQKFLVRYGSTERKLRAAIEAFPPSALQAWCEELGQPTFVGTSGRIFPRAMKASPILRAWLRRLAALNVTFKLHHQWLGWDSGGKLLFGTPDGEISADAPAAVFALGGASWPRLGSDGSWTSIFAGQGIAVRPLKPSNCGFAADLTEQFLVRFEGEPLNGFELQFEGVRVRGEAVVTKTGLEGGAVYALSSQLRDAIDAAGEAHLVIDLRPNQPAETLEASFSKANPKESMANVLRKAAKLPPVAAGLVQEVAHRNGQSLRTLGPKMLAVLVKHVPVRLVAVAPIEGAISSAGGVSFNELDEQFMLCSKPGVFIAGEMLDWEAPTGGYLLQACFSTGVAAAKGALAWLHSERRSPFPI
jgi:uncharacterized flavoprotein (TIGR03862 family)